MNLRRGRGLQSSNFPKKMVIVSSRAPWTHLQVEEQGAQWVVTVSMYPFAVQLKLFLRPI